MLNAAAAAAADKPADVIRHNQYINMQTARCNGATVKNESMLQLRTKDPCIQITD